MHDVYLLYLQAQVVIDLLRHHAVLIAVHKNLFTTDKPVDEEFSLFPFATINDKIYIRTAPDKGKFSNYTFRVSLWLNLGSVVSKSENSTMCTKSKACHLQKEFWPDLETEDYHESDLQLAYSYIFDVGFPPAMFAQVCSFICHWYLLIC